MTPPASENAGRILVIAIAVAAGSLIANLYYAQPLIATIARDLGVGTALAGTLVSATQVGYGAGLFLIVPLSDRIETRRLVLTMVALVLFALLAITAARSLALFLVASLALGLCCSVAQVLLPFLAQIVPEERRAAVVGNVMGGILAGVMLARPLALAVSAALGWRAIFWASGALLLVTGGLLAWLMPRHRPGSTLGYGAMLGSMAHLLRTQHEVRRRALYQAMMFAAFNMLWAIAPLVLARRFGLDPYHTALFALAGAGGALAAPIGARLADRGLIHAGTVGAAAVVALAFLGTIGAVAALSFAAFLLLTIAIDAGVQINQTLGRMVVFGAAADIRGRVNSLYMTTLYAGGAIGSTLGSVTFGAGGWPLTAGVAAALSAGVALLAVVDGRSDEQDRAASH